MQSLISPHEGMQALASQLQAEVANVEEKSVLEDAAMNYRQSRIKGSVRTCSLDLLCTCVPHEKPMGMEAFAFSTVESLSFWRVLEALP